MAASLPPTESLALVILAALDTPAGRIDDSRALSIPADVGAATAATTVGPSTEAQNAVKAALDSLTTREVRSCPPCSPTPPPLLLISPRPPLLGRERQADPKVHASQMVNFKQINIEQHVLTVEGTQIAQSGSHEFRVWAALPPPGSEAGLTAQQIGDKVGKDVAKVGQGKAMKNKWVAKKGDGFLQAVRLVPLSRPPSSTDEPKLTRAHTQQVPTVVDETQKDLVAIQSSGAHPDEKLLAELRKRKLVEKKCVLLLALSACSQADVARYARSQEVVLLLGREGRQLGDDDPEARDRPDGRAPQLVRLPLSALPHSLSRLVDSVAPPCSGEWEKAAFKKYNFEAEGAPTFGGALHPLMKVREEFRNIFFETGCVGRSSLCDLLRESQADERPLLLRPTQLHRDADEPLRRVVLLELRLALRPSAASGTRAAGHVLRQGCARTSLPLPLSPTVRARADALFPPRSQSLPPRPASRKTTTSASSGCTRSATLARPGTGTRSPRTRRRASSCARTRRPCRPPCCTSSPTRRAGSSRPRCSRSTACSATRRST